MKKFEFKLVVENDGIKAYGDYGTINMSDPKAADYHKLEGDEKAFTNDYNLDNVSMDYQAINNKIYQIWQPVQNKKNKPRYLDFLKNKIRRTLYKIKLSLKND